jgi:hypothetical protein
MEALTNGIKKGFNLMPLLLISWPYSWLPIIVIVNPKINITIIWLD